MTRRPCGRGPRRWGSLILNGAALITNGGKSTWYTVMAVTDPDRGANGNPAPMVHKDDEGHRSGKERKLGIKVTGPPSCTENAASPATVIGEPSVPVSRPGAGHVGPHPSHDWRWPWVSPRAGCCHRLTKDRKQFASISTFQAAVHAGRHGVMKVGGGSG